MFSSDMLIPGSLPINKNLFAKDPYTTISRDVNDAKMTLVTDHSS